MDLKAPDPFPELLERDDFGELFANTGFYLNKERLSHSVSTWGGPLTESAVWYYRNYTKVFIFWGFIFLDYSKTCIMLGLPLNKGRVWRSVFAYNKGLLCLRQRWRKHLLKILLQWPSRVVLSNVRLPRHLYYPSGKEYSSCSPTEAALCMLSGLELWPHPLMYG